MLDSNAFTFGLLLTSSLLSVHPALRESYDVIKYSSLYGSCTWCYPSSAVDIYKLHTLGHLPSFISFSLLCFHID